MCLTMMMGLATYSVTPHIHVSQQPVLQAMFSKRQKKKSLTFKSNSVYKLIWNTDHSRQISLLESCKYVFITSVGLPESAAEAVEWLARLDVLVLLVAAVVDSATELLSSKQDVISETECRLIPVPPPADKSTSYSTTGVSMGTL